MISTLTMHVRYGRSSSVIENNNWGTNPAAEAQIPQQWRSIWRTGYDGPWSSGSGSGTKDKSGDHSTSIGAVDENIFGATTDKLRNIGRRAKGRYRRALNVSEVTQPDPTLPQEPPGRRASELARLEEIDEEQVDGEDRPPIPFKTCPKSAPAILAQQELSSSVSAGNQVRRMGPAGFFVK